jgi:CRISPR-associated endonuclease/helicase Cas3
MKQNELWAKSPKKGEESGESLLAHSIKTARVSQDLLKNSPLSPEFISRIKKDLFLSCALHDAGKAATGFQNSLRTNGIWGKRHEILSAVVVSRVAQKLEIEGRFAVITHHKSIPPDNATTERESKCLQKNQLPFQKSSIWSEMLKELSDNTEPLKEYLLLLKEELNLEYDISSIGNGFSSDDIGMEEFWLDRTYQREFAKRKKVSLRDVSIMRGLLITSDHLASGQMSVPKTPVLSSYTTLILEKELKDSQALPFQNECGNLKGSAILKAPTGSGKTLAMLLWAANNQLENGRFFYTLPYTASINAMYQRLSDIFSRDLVGVLHHRNAAFLYRMLEDEHSTNAERYAKSLAGLAKEMYFPIKVLTPHQILKVALRGKGWELGLVEFQNACFVFDEIHAFEPKIVGLIVATSKWLQSMGAKILFASATMPKFLEEIFKTELGIDEKNVIEPNPEKEGDKQVCDKKRHKIQIRKGDLLENLDMILDDIVSNPKKKVLVVCNYVATSQEVAKNLKAKGIEFSLLHARFNQEDRFKIEKKITDINPPRVLVATQAVEVSLDIDYHCGYIEPAPIDALAQRFGRINRKGEREPALVTVFEKQSVPNGRIYDKSLVDKTVELLRQKDVLSEKDLVEILNDVYREGYKGEVEKKYKEGLNNTDIVEFDKHLIAGTYRDWVDTIIEKTDEQVEVLPENLSERYKGHIKNNEYLKAKMLLVPVRIGQFNKVKAKNLVSKDTELEEYVVFLPYSPETGLDLTGQIDYMIT